MVHRRLVVVAAAATRQSVPDHVVAQQVATFVAALHVDALALVRLQLRREHDRA